MNHKEHRGPYLFGLGVGVALLLALGAGGWGFLGTTIASAAEKPVAAVRALVSPLTVTSISGALGAQAIQIDDLDNNVNTTPNANMTTGGITDTTCVANPAGEVDSNCPATSPSLAYIDWNNLAPPPAGKFVIIDGTGSTDDSFAGTPSHSCLQPAHAAPQKEDIYRVYLANNSQYLYFGEVDKAPQGDSRHVFLLHKNAITEATATCAGDGHDISVVLTADDKLILAVFKPSASTPAAQLYTRVGGTTASLLIDQAADFLNTSLWAPTSGIANFAVNDQDIPTDALGAGQPNSSPVLAQTFGEGAVSLSALGITGCGGVYNVSIITRSSGSGSGESKDFVGGAYNFGSIAVTADLTPSCNAEFNFTSQATDVGGTNIPDGDATYAWTCDNGATPTGKAGTEPAAAGTYTCTVTATQISTSCQATSASDTVNVYGALSVAVDAVPACSLTFDTNSTVTGGSGSVSHAWTKDSGPGTLTFASASSEDTTATASVAGTYGVKDTVTDLRTDLPAASCTASDTDTAAVSVLTATAALTDSCSLSFNYSSTNPGAIGVVTYAWAFSGPTTVTPSSSTTASGSATVGAPGGVYTGNLTVTDTRTDGGNPARANFQCTATASDTGETYGPITVDITPDATALTCPAVDTAGTDVTYNSTVGGGKPPYTRTWTVTGENNAAACGNTASCLVDSAPGNYCAVINVSVSVDDSFALCSPATDGPGVVTKTTSVSATDP